MSNLTIALDDQVIRQARIRAIQEGTSVSARVREFLAQYARGEPVAAEARTPAAEGGGGSSYFRTFDGVHGLRAGIDGRSNRALDDAAEDVQAMVRTYNPTPSDAGAR